VSFHTIDSRAFLDEEPEPFDLVLLVDVLHHVKVASRDDLLDDMRQLTTPGGHYAVKDWVRSRSIAHLAAWASDRLVTGDRVAYFEDDEIRALVPSRFPGDAEVLSARIAPRRNNVLLVYRRD
jgi:2-polyprenyl-6-hydroxyphenyl methylase/3-demethylubiquinone-9 3-methyltransferase